MKTITEEQIKEFLNELSKLSRRHKIIIGGCGCCGSPFLMPMSKDGRYSADGEKNGYAENLDWNSLEENE